MKRPREHFLEVPKEIDRVVTYSSASLDVSLTHRMHRAPFISNTFDRSRKVKEAEKRTPRPLL